MENDLILEIDNVGPISQANIEIGKINVVGGINSSGKSTASKLLYCFLRANSQSAEQLTLERGAKIIRNISSRLRRFGRDFDSEDEDKLREIFHYFMRSRGHLDDISLEDLLDFSDSINLIYEKYFLDENRRRLKSLDDYIDAMNEFVDNIMDNPNYIYESALIQLLDSELNVQGPTKYGGIATLSSSSANFNDQINFDNYEKSHLNDYFIEDIYYLDSFSIFDDETEGLSNVIHVNSLKRSLNQKFLIIPGVNDTHTDTIKEIEGYIRNKLIKGDIVNINPRENIFKSNDNIESLMKNTASGIKQIGVVQKLIEKHKLTPGNFLIIDEPEVNLHPEWQIKFAELLAKIASDLEVTIYVNTHSPMFIEAITLYAEFFDLLDEFSLYLTEKDTDYKDDDSVKYKFNRINPKNMGAVYENLSRPYDVLDELKSDILDKKIANG